MKPNKYPLSRKENIVVQELDGEVLIYDLSENKAFCLNETSALVWEMCDGNKSISEISEGLGKKLNSKASEDLVWLALDQLKKEKLIANSEEIAYDFNGMSRRDVIKKVGLGTMIALPIVTGLVAPTALHAQSASACANGCVCSVTNTSGATASCTGPTVSGSIVSGCGRSTTGTGTIPAGCTCQVPNNSNNGTCVLVAGPPPAPVCSAPGATCTCSIENTSTTSSVTCASLGGNTNAGPCPTGCTTCTIPAQTPATVGNNNEGTCS